MADAPGIRLFVYGSLRRGGSHHHLLRGGRFIAPVRLFGYELFVYQGGYPAVAPCDGKPEVPPVVGECWEVDAAHLVHLDAFEECPHLYQRTCVELEDGQQAHLYCVAAEEALGRSIVSSGDWLVHVCSVTS